MSLQINLRHLDEHSLQLEGTLPVAELDIDTRDDVVQLSQPLEYKLEAQKLEDGLLVQGLLSLRLKCHCVRCLKAFDYELVIDPWTSHLPLQGEEAVPVNNDLVDLTPWIREDILLELPPHPLCERDCRGLGRASADKSKTFSHKDLPEVGSPAWNELNKLKF